MAAGDRATNWADDGRRGGTRGRTVTAVLSNVAMEEVVVVGRVGGTVGNVISLVGGMVGIGHVTVGMVVVGRVGHVTVGMVVVGRVGHVTVDVVVVGRVGRVTVDMVVVVGLTWASTDGAVETQRSPAASMLRHTTPHIAGPRSP
jgi:hypothetical protein